MNSRGMLLAAAAILALGLGLVPAGARAATGEVRIAREYGLGYLPTMVMEERKLLEKHARALGIPEVKVRWLQLTNAAAMNDAILAGDLDFASGAVTAPIIVWDRTRGTPSAVMAVCGESVIPFTMYSSKPQIKSIRDFRDGDKIALPGIKVTTYAILLQMAAADAYGQAEFRRIDPLTVSMPHPEALQALFTGQITADFTWPPFSYEEAARPGIHKVLDSTEIMGGQPMSSTVIWARKAFHDQQPKLYQAFLDAMKESVEFIQQHKDEAARIYVQATHSKQPIDKMLADPTITFDVAPHGVMKFATFLHAIGTIKNQPQSWKDVYFPEVHNLAGD